MGLEVIYSEEQPYGELIQLPIWNPPRTHVIPSNPLTTSMRVDNYGGGSVCVGEMWGEVALAPFPLLSPLPSGYKCLHLSRA